jgi:hypothetical protein
MKGREGACLGVETRHQRLGKIMLEKRERRRKKSAKSFYYTLKFSSF